MSDRVVQFSDLEDLEERLFQRFEEIVYKSHVSIKEVDSGLHKKLLDRLDDQDTVLIEIRKTQTMNTTKTNEMYEILTTSKTLWEALKTVGNAIIKIGVIAAAIVAIKSFLKI